MAFTPRIVGGTDIHETKKPHKTGEETNVIKDNTRKRVNTFTSNDPFKNIDGIFTDSEFDKKINYILDMVGSLEHNDMKGRDRWTIWREQRKQHNINQMTDIQLKNIVMSAEDVNIQRKPAYFTGICGEIMERILGNIERVK